MNSTYEDIAKWLPREEESTARQKLRDVFEQLQTAQRELEIERIRGDNGAEFYRQRNELQEQLEAVRRERDAMEVAIASYAEVSGVLVYDTSSGVAGIAHVSAPEEALAEIAQLCDDNPGDLAQRIYAIAELALYGPTPS